MARFGPDYASPIERLKRNGTPLERDAMRKRGELVLPPVRMFTERVISEPLVRDTHAYGLVEDARGDYRLAPATREDFSVEISSGKVVIYERREDRVLQDEGPDSFLVRVRTGEAYEFVPALLKLTAGQAERVLACGQQDFDVYVTRRAEEGDSDMFAVRDIDELRGAIREPDTRLFLGARVKEDFNSLCWFGFIRKEPAP